MKFIILAMLFSQQLFAAYLVKKVDQRVESVKRIKQHVSKITLIKSIQEHISERDQLIARIYTEELYPENLIPKEYLNYLNLKNKNISWTDTEVRELIKQGPYENRINVTFLGDGYTLSEKEKFFNDVNRLVNDLFKEITFKSYLPIFNIVAIYVPSKDSGITDLEEKQTAFSLYRTPKGSKRAIIPGDKRAIEMALDLVDFYTHYPIIIANDEYYGGLGGRYAITTRSLDSGSMVLRHELGHNFSNVGEEYDGGQVYSGANFSSTTNVSWKHWLEGNLSINKAKFLTGAYLWQNLGLKDYVETFNFYDTKDHLFDLEISSVGWESTNDVKAFLDGVELELDGVYTKDRSFFKTKKVLLSPGIHEIKIIDNNQDGDNVLAFANGKAYPLNYDNTENKVGAYNVFDDSQKQRGYRPTDKQCLMRNMRSKVFCSVDQENIWIRFLEQINLIDDIQIKSNGLAILKLPALNGLQIKWFKKSLLGKSEIVELRNFTKVDLSQYQKGTYEVEVSFVSSEIRKHSTELVDTKIFKL